MRASTALLCVISGFLITLLFGLMISGDESYQKEGNIGPVLDSSLERKYGVVFDLGSSGSRANIFSWKRNHLAHCSVANGSGFDQLRPLPDGTKKIKPGVSEKEYSPETVGDSLEELWQFIRENVPEQEWSSTPIFMYATAGLRVVAERNNERMYDDDDADDNVILEEDDDDFERGNVAKILNHLRSFVKDNTPFKLIRNDHIRVLTGSEEGLYDFLTVQQLVRINPFAKVGGPAGTTWSERIFDPAIYIPSTLLPLSTIDLGGASTQVSMEVHEDEANDEGLVSYEIQQFSPSVFKAEYPKIFTHSYLGYGINRAKEEYTKIVLNQPRNANEVHDPCRLVDHNETIVLDGVEYEWIGQGSFMKCKQLIRSMFELSQSKGCDSCTFSDIRRPHTSSLSNTTIIAFDNAFKIVSSFGLHGFVEMDDIIQKLRIHFEFTMPEALNHYTLSNNDIGALSFKGMYLYSLLHSGYQQRDTVVFADTIDGQSLSWAMGALVFDSVALCKHDLL